MIILIQELIENATCHDYQTAQDKNMAYYTFLIGQRLAKIINENQLLILN